MNPPGMTDRSRGGADGGGPRSSSRICLGEQRLGYASRRGNRSPGKASAQEQGPSTGALLCWAQPHRAGCWRGCGLLASTRLARECCDEQEEKHQEEKPHGEALRFPHATKGRALRGAHRRCQLCPAPGSSGTATGGTILAAASGSWRHHGHMQTHCRKPQAETRPHVPQLPQQRAVPAVPSRSSASTEPCRHPRVSALRGTVCSEQWQKIAQTRTFRLQRCLEPARLDTARATCAGRRGDGDPRRAAGWLQCVPPPGMEPLGSSQASGPGTPLVPPQTETFLLLPERQA